MSTYTMCAVLHNLARILEAPLTYVQPVGLPPTEKIFWIDRRVPRLNVQVSKHDVCHVRLHGGPIWRSIG